jgi:hypothetical protein
LDYPEVGEQGLELGQSHDLVDGLELLFELVEAHLLLVLLHVGLLLLWTL